MNSTFYLVNRERRWLWLLVLAISFSGIGMSQHIPEGAFADHVIWQNGTGSYAEFIPESQLQNESLKRLPYHPEQIGLFEQRTLAKYDDISKREPHKSECSVTSHSRAASTGGGMPHHLVDVLQSRGIAVYGHVVDVQVGWGIGGVKTMVYLRTEEILHCDAGSRTRMVSAGDVVSVSMAKGEISVDGVWLCNRTDEALSVPSVGDHVVVAGYPFPSDPYFLAGGLVLPLNGDYFQPQPYKQIAMNTASDYETVRAYFATKHVSCGEVMP